MNVCKISPAPKCKCVVEKSRFLTEEKWENWNMAVTNETEFHVRDECFLIILSTRKTFGVCFPLINSKSRCLLHFNLFHYVCYFEPQKSVPEKLKWKNIVQTIYFAKCDFNKHWNRRNCCRKLEIYVQSWQQSLSRMEKRERRDQRKINWLNFSTFPFRRCERNQSFGKSIVEIPSWNFLLWGENGSCSWYVTQSCQKFVMVDFNISLWDENFLRMSSLEIFLVVLKCQNWIVASFIAAAGLQINILLSPDETFMQRNSVVITFLHHIFVRFFIVDKKICAFWMSWVKNLPFQYCFRVRCHWLRKFWENIELDEGKILVDRESFGIILISFGSKIVTKNLRIILGN